MFGNPHSGSLSSMASTSLVEETRRRILEFFHAPPGLYTVVFTQNATAALKLVGEAYPFTAGSRFVADVRQPQLGQRHSRVRVRRGRVRRVCAAHLARPAHRRRACFGRCLTAADRGANNLFAFPAQSNFSGVQHPLELVDAGARDQGWDVLLDAAAFVPTNRLDLSKVQPDFVTISFYKMFGYPSGVGCLLIRTDTIAKMRRPWFAGGTVNFATVQGRRHVLAPREAGFEDGTCNYLNIPAVEIGLRHLSNGSRSTPSTRACGV